jgi:hypothetical protein
MCQKNASHGLYKFCLVFDPTQYDHTIEDELHWGGWDAIAFIHSFIFSFFLFHTLFFFGQTQGKTTNPSYYKSIV